MQMTIKKRLLSIEKYLYTRGYFFIYAAIVIFTSFSPVTVAEAVEANTQTTTESQTDDNAQPDTATPSSTQQTDTSTTSSSSTNNNASSSSVS